MSGSGLILPQRSEAEARAQRRQPRTIASSDLHVVETPRPNAITKAARRSARQHNGLIWIAEAIALAALLVCGFFAPEIIRAVVEVLA